MSTTISIRGRCAGSAPRLIRRLSARACRPRAMNHRFPRHGPPRPARLFETQQHLVLPLQLLDDLAQPVVLHSLGEQHSF
jgi:hypothetical protein